MRKHFQKIKRNKSGGPRHAKPVCEDPYEITLFLNFINPKHAPLNAGIKSLRATLPDETFYYGFCFLNRAFR
jgi:hypothetical protein